LCIRLKHGGDSVFSFRLVERLDVIPDAFGVPFPYIPRLLARRLEVDVKASTSDTLALAKAGLYAI
jgi:hypothetical protein